MNWSAVFGVAVLRLTLNQTGDPVAALAVVLFGNVTVPELLTKSPFEAWADEKLRKLSRASLVYRDGTGGDVTLWPQLVASVFRLHSPPGGK